MSNDDTEEVEEQVDEAFLSKRNILKIKIKFMKCRNYFIKI